MRKADQKVRFAGAERAPKKKNDKKSVDDCSTRSEGLENAINAETLKK